MNFFNINSYCGNYLTVAFRLRDSFNDQILEKEINSNFIFYLNDAEIKPIRKDNGYCVISNFQSKQFTLKIFSDNYFCKTVFIDIDKIKNNNQYGEIYLIPHYQHEKPPSDIYIEGKADINTLVFATKLSNRTNIRYINFDKKEMALSISNPVNESLVGRLMAVVDLDNNKFQSFFIKDKFLDASLNSVYEIDSEIDKSYKTSMPIQKVYITKSDEFGSYRIYINNPKIENEQYIIFFYKNKKKTYKIIDINN